MFITSMSPGLYEASLVYLDFLSSKIYIWICFFMHSNMYYGIIFYGFLFNLIVVFQIKFSIYLAMGRMGLCLGPSKMGTTASFCTGGFGKGSAPIILGQN